MCKIELKISYDCCPGRLLKRGGEYNLYLLTPGVLIEKHYIRVAILCYKTYYLSRGVSSESVFRPFWNSCFGVCCCFLKECQRLEYISGWQPAILPLAQICEALCGDQHNMHCLANKDGQPATESKQALFVRGNLPTCRYQANKEDFPALSSCVELFPIQQVI